MIVPDFHEVWTRMQGKISWSQTLVIQSNIEPIVFFLGGVRGVALKIHVI